MVEEYWRHARHQEDQRLRFAQLYLVMVGALIAYFGAVQGDLAAQGLPDTGAVGIPIVILAAAASIFGWVSTQVWSNPFAVFSRLAERIELIDLGMPPRYARLYPKRDDKTFGIGRLIATAYRLFSLLYIFGVSASVAVISGYLWGPGAAMASLGGTFVLVALLFSIVEHRTVSRVQSKQVETLNRWYALPNP